MQKDVSLAVVFPVREEQVKIKVLLFKFIGFVRGYLSICINSSKKHNIRLYSIEFK